MVIQMYYENHVSRGTCKRDTCHKNDQKKGLHRYEVVGGLDDIKVKNKIALNAAQIDKLTEFFGARRAREGSEVIRLQMVLAFSGLTRASFLSAALKYGFELYWVIESIFLSIALIYCYCVCGLEGSIL
jgi:hypothetical protein